MTAAEVCVPEFEGTHADGFPGNSMHATGFCNDV